MNWSHKKYYTSIKKVKKKKEIIMGISTSNSKELEIITYDLSYFW